MYAALWRALPGPVWVRVLLLVLLVAGVLTACVLWIFPWIDTTFFVPDSTVGGAT
ncbi:MAG TPA: hypothetical protein VNQ48_01870 [Microbacteriaceae bacterium]|nr:hypothetical protein [Microbacteriaceae bacterium]